MSTIRLLSAGSLLLVLVMASKTAAQGDDSLHNYALATERMTREYVIERVAPKIPEEVLQEGKQGLIIVAVVFDEDGKLWNAAVLEAPHPLLKQPVLDALKEWSITKHGTSMTPLVKTVGWLSFDFKIVDGKGQIEYAGRNQLGDKEDRRYRHPFERSGRGWFYRFD